MEALERSLMHKPAPPAPAPAPGARPPRKSQLGLIAPLVPSERRAAAPAPTPAPAPAPAPAPEPLRRSPRAVVLGRVLTGPPAWATNRRLLWICGGAVLALIFTAEWLRENHERTPRRIAFSDERGDDRARARSFREHVSRRGRCDEVVSALMDRPGVWHVRCSPEYRYRLEFNWSGEWAAVRRLR